MNENERYENVINWLLEDDQPAVKLLTLTQLLGKGQQDPEIQSAMREIHNKGWAAEILAKQQTGGWWISPESLYKPKYLSTNWMLLILSDLGLTKENRNVAKGCELWIERFRKPDGGFAMEGSKRSHLCTTGNTARALVKFGYEDHPSVRSAFEWMAATAAERGGWSCFGSGRNLDSWEPMSAFAAYPKHLWTRKMKAVVEKGAEFFLERELHVQGGHYEPWYRLHYPVHYYYDLLVGLDFITALGYTDDGRLKHAIGFLRGKMRSDGRWELDAVHPDVEGGLGDWYKAHPKQAPAPFSLEANGEPSKMVTLRALVVLSRLRG